MTTQPSGTRHVEDLGGIGCVEPAELGTLHAKNKVTEGACSLADLYGSMMAITTFASTS